MTYIEFGPSGRCLIVPRIWFRLGAPLRTLNEIKRMHHRVYSRYRASLALEVSALTTGRRPAVPFKRAYVRVERHSAGTVDQDNLQASIKPLMDILQPFSVRCPSGLGIIAGDDPASVRVDVLQFKCARGQGSTLVDISEVLP